MEQSSFVDIRATHNTTTFKKKLYSISTSLLRVAFINCTLSVQGCMVSSRRNSLSSVIIIIIIIIIRPITFQQHARNHLWSKP